MRDHCTQRDVRQGKEIDLPEPASDLADVFMPAASGAFVACVAGLLAMVGLRAGTGASSWEASRGDWAGRPWHCSGLTSVDIGTALAGAALAAAEDECGKAAHGVTSHMPEIVGRLILHVDGCFGSARPACPGQDESRCAR